jgi:predicted metal-dependent phosphoesterase TrpH
MYPGGIMGIIKQEDIAKKATDQANPENSLYVADEKVDRNGNAWKKKQIWIRSEHLGKMKVLAHFEKKTTQVIIDQALEDYFRAHFDDSMAMKKMIKKSGY